MSAAAAVPIRDRIVQQFDLERIRKDFPILHTKVHGHPLVYLDNAATSQKPRSVIDALVRYYEGENANIHRGVHYLSQIATEEFEKARETVRAFVNAAQASEIIFTRGTTEAINLVAQTYGRTHVGAGDEVLITAMEHHSNIVPWQTAVRRKGREAAGRADQRQRARLVLEESRSCWGHERRWSRWRMFQTRWGRSIR